jgi:hypothetical protein
MILTHGSNSIGSGGGGGEVIPDGYSKVSYLEFRSPHNYDYFAFDIHDLNSDDKYYFKLFINTPNGEGSGFYIIDVRGSGGMVLAYPHTYGLTNYTLEVGRAPWNNINITAPLGNLELEFIESGKVRVNGVDHTLMHGTFTNGTLEYFLTHESYPERLDGTKFFKGVITDSSDNLKYNFIPVVNNNTGVGYIYESVTGTLKTNSNWIAGPIV